MCYLLAVICSLTPRLRGKSLIDNIVIDHRRYQRYSQFALLPEVILRGKMLNNTSIC